MANSKSPKSSKSSKSNKTAHVLNLLTEPGEVAESPVPKQANHTPPAPPVAPADNSEEMAESIRSALEEDLLAELEEEPQQPRPQPDPVTEPVPSAPVIPEPEPAPAPVPAPEPEKKPQPAPHTSGITYLNVMQALVEDKVDKYIERFHMCDCERCRTDVIALTLTSLPAKYIVVPESEGVPMLTIYESRYSAAVTAQLMSACQKVSQHPRHSDSDDGMLRLGAPRHDD